MKVLLATGRSMKLIGFLDEIRKSNVFSAGKFSG